LIFQKCKFCQIIFEGCFVLLMETGHFLWTLRRNYPALKLNNQTNLNNMISMRCLQTLASITYNYNRKSTEKETLSSLNLIYFIYNQYSTFCSRHRTPRPFLDLHNQICHTRICHTIRTKHNSSWKFVH
jgi:hypothetical protein